MHHGQAFAKDVNAREAAAFEDSASPLGLEEREAQQHDDARAKVERMRDELLGELKRRIRDDAPAAVRRLPLQEKIAAGKKVGPPVIDEIRADDFVTVRTQHIDDVAVAGGRLP